MTTKIDGLQSELLQAQKDRENKLALDRQTLEAKAREDLQKAEDGAKDAKSKLEDVSTKLEGMQQNYNDVKSQLATANNATDLANGLLQDKTTQYETVVKAGSEERRKSQFADQLAHQYILLVQIINDDFLAPTNPKKTNFRNSYRTIQSNAHLLWQEFNLPQADRL